MLVDFCDLFASFAVFVRFAFFASRCVDDVSVGATSDLAEPEVLLDVRCLALALPPLLPPLLRRGSGLRALVLPAPDAVEDFER